MLRVLLGEGPHSAQQGLQVVQLRTCMECCYSERACFISVAVCLLNDGCSHHGWACAAAPYLVHLVGGGGSGSFVLLRDLQHVSNIQGISPFGFRCRDPLVRAVLWLCSCSCLAAALKFGLAVLLGGIMAGGGALDALARSAAAPGTTSPADSSSMRLLAALTLSRQRCCFLCTACTAAGTGGVHHAVSSTCTAL